jgi:hypothetical protein
LSTYAYRAHSHEYVNEHKERDDHNTLREEQVKQIETTNKGNSRQVRENESSEDLNLSSKNVSTEKGIIISANEDEKEKIENHKAEKNSFLFYVKYKNTLKPNEWLKKIQVDRALIDTYINTLPNRSLKKMNPLDFQ